MLFSSQTMHLLQCIALFLILYCPLPTVAQSNVLSPNKPINKFLLDHWTIEDGLPSSALVSIMQSSEGYLWLTSYNGVIRFDGVRFTVFDKEKYPAFKTNTTITIFETTQRELLIGTENSGVIRYKKGKFETLIPYNQIHGAVQTISEDNEGNIWLGLQGKGLVLWQRKTKEVNTLNLIAGMDKVTVNALRYDNRNQHIMWIGTNKLGLIKYNLNTKAITTYNTDNGLYNNNIQYIFFDKYLSKIWVATTMGTNYIENEVVYKIFETTNLATRSIVQDKTGNIWLGTQKGLLRYNIKQQKVEVLTESQDGVQLDIRYLTIDHEESLWITTYRTGLLRIKNGKFTNYGVKDGIATPTVNHIAETKDHKILVGTENGTINVIDKDSISTLVYKTALPNDKRIKHILVDSKGWIWLSTYSGLLVIQEHGKEVLYTDKNGLSSLQVRFAYEDTAGIIWIGTRSGGLIRFNGKNFVAFNKENGFPSDFIMSIKEITPNQYWVTTNDAGLMRIDQNGNVQEHYHPKNGFVTNTVFSVLPEDTNKSILWLATNHGLIQLNTQTKKFVVAAIKNGLPDDNIFDIQEDNGRNLWITSGKGLIKINRQALGFYVNDTTKQLQYTLYEKHDGMIQTECTGATFALKSSRGQLWFPTLGGVVMVNPQDLTVNTIKPPVYMEHIKIDETIDFYIDSLIVIPAGKQRFWIDYTALSLIAPQKVEFKYQLENFDKTWVNANQERRALYTNVAPGTYYFKVVASNNDGIWNNKGATVKIIVQPYFWQTKWFFLLLGTSLLGLIWWVARQRIRYIEARNKELEQLVQSRTIALQRTTDEVSLKNSALEQQQVEILAQQEEILQTNETLQLTFNELQHKNENIMASINYARQIQQAMLPSEVDMQKYLPHLFVFYQPRDIVSGDFYWFHVVENEQHQVQKICIAAIDCTGHGVPGAFMSMASNAFLNQIVKVQDIYEPHAILNLLHTTVRHSLRQADTDNRDGMDISFCTIDREQQTLYFAGANNPLMIVHRDTSNNEVILDEYTANREPIGGSWGKVNNETRNYQLHTIAIEKGMYCYIFSDGYQDQFGGMQNKKFTKKQLKNLLLSFCQQPFELQKNVAHQTFIEWKGIYSQLDDVLLIGFEPAYS